MSAALRETIVTRLGLRGATWQRTGHSAWASTYTLSGGAERYFVKLARHPTLLACEADARGRLGFEQREYPQRAFFAQARERAAAVALDPAERAGMSGEKIGQELHRRRLAAIEELKTQLVED